MAFKSRLFAKRLNVNGVKFSSDRPASKLLWLFGYQQKYIPHTTTRS